MWATLKEWVPLVVLGFNVAMFVVIKFNDLSHLDKSVDEFKNLIKDMDKKLDVTSERIAKIEGRCSVNHS